MKSGQSMFEFNSTRVRAAVSESAFVRAQQISNSSSGCLFTAAFLYPLRHDDVDVDALSKFLFGQLARGQGNNMLFEAHSPAAVRLNRPRNSQNNSEEGASSNRGQRLLQYRRQPAAVDAKKNEAATRIVASQDRKVYPYRLTAGMCESRARTLMSKEQNDEDNPYSILNRRREKCS